MARVTAFQAYMRITREIERLAKLNEAEMATHGETPFLKGQRATLTHLKREVKRLDADM